MHTDFQSPNQKYMWISSFSHAKYPLDLNKQNILWYKRFKLLNFDAPISVKNVVVTLNGH